eukprot:GFYU01001481.1.p1 GENE.GFYU01001481.1~~GFYU01001481.1.p1  ORF type:complete len:330 (-),score=87.18 GFYU01001481.1:21-872(-)
MPTALAAATSQVGAGSVTTRKYSTSGDLVTLERRDDGICIVRLNRPPVNSLNLDMWQAISAALTEVEGDKKIKGAVLASSNPTVFSAGLDITEMHKPDPDRLREFWATHQKAWLQLYAFKKPIAAAIEGHSPAGGCLLAMSCDYRVLSDQKALIGLNETQLGLVAPPWYGDVMVNTIGSRQSERCLMHGLRLTAEEALRVGMVDEVVPKEEVMGQALAEVQKLVKIPAHARFGSKMLIRQPAIDKLNATIEDDIKLFTGFVTQPQVQAVIDGYLASLGGGKKK